MVVADGLNVDLGANGELIGLEIERASKHLDPSIINPETPDTSG